VPSRHGQGKLYLLHILDGICLRLLEPLSAESRAAGYVSVACKFIYVYSPTDVMERVTFSLSGLSCAFSLGCSHTNLIRPSCVKLYSSCVFGWYTC
jgi:hypothetical protein